MSFEELSKNVISIGLCARCGICAGACPVNAIGLDKNNFPVLTGDCINCQLCVKSCPGAEVNFPALSSQVFNSEYDSNKLQGFVNRTFVAHATREEVRTSGTSGGMVTALLIHLLNSKQIDGAVVAGFDSDDPCRMRGKLATTPDEIVTAAKSKYCLTSSMEALQLVRKRKGRFAVVGLPCQIQGMRKLMAYDSSLRDKIYCVLGLYCHCNMEPYLQYDILKNLGIKPESISRFDFRGGVWPGGFHVVDKAGRKVPLHSTLYTTILNVLFKIYGASRCYLCIDALSYFADISFGDFWAQDYLDDFSHLERCTLISQRTEKGLAILKQAEKEGAVTLYDLPPERYSKRILSMAKGKKNKNFARIESLRRKGEPVPEYHVPLPVLTKKTKRKEMILRFFFLFRGRLARRIILRLLFSRAANGFEKINLLRKKTFCNYHSN